MLIDWFTILAQALNFLILVWLMKRFLYKPVIRAIDSREKLIATKIEDADKKNADAKKESDEFKQKNEKFDQEHATLLNKAKDEARTERERLLDEAKKTAAALSSKLHEGLKSDEHNLQQTAARRIQQEVLAIARKVLADLAGTSLEERIVAVFIHRLHELGQKEKDQLTSTLKASPSPAIVSTSFNLNPEQRTATQSAINELLGSQAQIQFATAQNLVSGIELTLSGQKVAWSIADYMTSLEKGIDDLLEKKEQPEVKAKPETKAAPKAMPKPEPKLEVMGK